MIKLLFFLTLLAIAPNILSDAKPELSSKDSHLVQQLIVEAKRQRSIDQRIKLISGRLLGYPYLVKPLQGSATEQEILVARMDGFDCFTYVETVLAMAGARDVDDYLRRLREIRYVNGDVNWRNRLHYTIDWANYHIERGMFEDLTQGDGVLTITKRLAFVPGLEPRTVALRYFPKHELPNIAPRLKDGDLIYFVSARRDLDVFHIGILVREGDRLLIRHARRIRGRVMEQDLDEFCRRSKTAGFIINRPVFNS